MTARVVAAAFIASLCLLACEDHKQPPPSYDASRVRRVFRPLPDQVRPVPPHAIHARGVGPYELGMSLQDILDLLARGPRVVLTRIDDVLHYNLVRAERETMVIGVTRPRGVVFVSVLDERIARTESGVGVGTSLADLTKALGPPMRHASLAMDPRMIGFDRLENARFVLAGNDAQRTVAAITIRRSDPRHSLSLPGEGEGEGAGDQPPPIPPRGKRKATTERRGEAAPKKAGSASKSANPGSDPAPTTASGPRPCDPEALLEHRDAVIAAARLPAPERVRARVTPGCFSSPASPSAAASPTALVTTHARVVVVAGDPGKLRRLVAHSAEGIVHAARLDVDGDGRDEIAVVSENDRVGAIGRERISRIEILRWESGRLHTLANQELYRLSTQSTAWVGAALDDIDLLLELWAGTDRVEVSGLYVQWSDRGRPINAALLLPVRVPIKPRRPPAPLANPPSPDSGTPPTPVDAGPAAPTQDAGPTSIDAAAIAPPPPAAEAAEAPDKTPDKPPR